MSSAKPFEFEKALKELEEITAWFESSDVDLDQGLAKFERGLELSAQLKDHLQEVENRVEKIKARFSDGAPTEAKPAEPKPPQRELDDDDDTEQAGLF